jgi:antitoxin HigA-1
MVRIPKFREPTHPGEMLMEEFLAPMSMPTCKVHGTAQR